MSEQPQPRANDTTPIQQLVIRDMNARWALGVERYGTSLQVGNGRRMSQDFLEELQDALVYATGIREQDCEIIMVLRHLLDIHRRAPGTDTCLTCAQLHPCHTTVDIDKILVILGATNDTVE